MCGEHGVPEAECGICNPDAVARLAPGQSLKVRLPSTDSAAVAGVETSTPAVGAVDDALECYAELAYDGNRTARVSAPVGGIVQEVKVDLGERVVEGAIVARIWSATIAETVARAVLSHQTLTREHALRAERVTSEKELQEAQASHRAACQQLRTLGFTEQQIDVMGAKPDESVMLDVRAPFAGEIVERTAVRGALVEVGTALFTVADRAVMWAMLNIPEPGLARVAAGQRVELRIDALPGRVFEGRLTWIGAEVDPRTRMARARAEVPNADGILRANMFAEARIVTRRVEGATLVPPSALQWHNGRALVFVREADDLWSARAVRLGVRAADRIEVIEGVAPEETVAVRHGFALKSQLLISRLGAGCADD